MSVKCVFQTKIMIMISSQKTVFFVYEKYQGEPYHIGRKLYDELLSFAKKETYKTILLDTPHNTDRAHKFYERASFKKVNETDLPIQFSHPYKDCDFFLL